MTDLTGIAGLTVLIVDDDPDLRSSLCEALEDAGYTTAQANNGREAIAWLDQHKLPALILLDLNMPVMTGWEFLNHQQVDPKLSQVPVVVITASGSAKKAAVTASAVLHKPITLDELLDVVGRFAASAQAS